MNLSNVDRFHFPIEVWVGHREEVYWVQNRKLPYNIVCKKQYTKRVVCLVFEKQKSKIPG